LKFGSVLIAERHALALNAIEKGPKRDK